ncbi:MAG: phosphoribosyltransferase domain-containing protein, partial [Bacillota bacterium]|nr:phosphoribosyltransferase domain-containing protein [Bacillota bacterium]
MQNSQTLTCSEQKYTYNILHSISADIEVKQNPFDLPLNSLFKMAARINKKRSFLFVSKLIGKHLPIDPQNGLLAGEMLAAVYMQTVKGVEIKNREEFRSMLLSEEPFLTGMRYPGNPLIIGFAETATALGHAFFDCFPEADYVHTTREQLVDKQSAISFEEEHSHATSHRCYLSVDMIANEREIILVDDELTTGKTSLNIIKSIHKIFPRNDYTVVSILDWRSDADRKAFK